MQKARPPQIELLRTGLNPRYHLNSAPPHGKHPRRVQTYPIAFTGEPVAAYSGDPFQCAALGMYSLPGCLPPRTTRRLSEGHALPYLFPVVAFFSEYHGQTVLSRGSVNFG